MHVASGRQKPPPNMPRSRKHTRHSAKSYVLVPPSLASRAAARRRWRWSSADDCPVEGRAVLPAVSLPRSVASPSARAVLPPHGQPTAIKFDGRSAGLGRNSSRSCTNLHTSKNRLSGILQNLLLLLVVLGTGGIRVGEACHPGPAVTGFDSPDLPWSEVGAESDNDFEQAEECLTSGPHEAVQRGRWALMSHGRWQTRTLDSDASACESLPDGAHPRCPQNLERAEECLTSGPHEALEQPRDEYDPGDVGFSNDQLYD